MKRRALLLAVMCSALFVMVGGLLSERRHGSDARETMEQEIRMDSGATGSKTVEHPAPRLEPTGAFILAENRVHHAGQVQEGAYVTHEFPILNISDSTLELEVTDVSCGCTEAILERSVLAAGEQTYLRMTMDTRHRLGLFGVLTTVNVSGSATESASFRMEAFITKPFTSFPSTMDLGRISRGEKRQVVFKLIGTAGNELRLTSIDLDGQDADDFTTEIRRIGEHELLVVLKFVPDTVGHHRIEIAFEADDPTLGAEHASLSYSVVGETAGR